MFKTFTSTLCSSVLFLTVAVGAQDMRDTGAVIREIQTQNAVIRSLRSTVAKLCPSAETQPMGEGCRKALSELQQAEVVRDNLCKDSRLQERIDGCP
jgi:hypothetical protein